MREWLRSVGDQRVVVADPQVRYFGARLSSRTLLPGDGVHLGPTPIRRLAEALDRFAGPRVRTVICTSNAIESLTALPDL